MAQTQALTQAGQNTLAGLDALSPEMLAELQGLAKPEDMTVGEGGPATLKINYDEESMYGTGVWIIGQKKDDNQHIVEEGHKIEQIIILTSRLQYSHYDKDNKANCFNTQMYFWGGKAPDQAEFDAKLVSIGKAGEGRFRVVVFALAVLPDGNTVECVMYLGGTSYPNAKAHLDIFSRKNLPHFVAITNLPATSREKNGSRTYFIANFEVGEALYSNKEMLHACRDKVEEIGEYVDTLNAKSDFAQSATQQAPAAPVAAPVAAPQAPPQAPQTPASNFAQSTGEEVFVDDLPPNLKQANVGAAGLKMPGAAPAVTAQTQAPTAASLQVPGGAAPQTTVVVNEQPAAQEEDLEALIANAISAG